MFFYCLVLCNGIVIFQVIILSWVNFSWIKLFSVIVYTNFQKGNDTRIAIHTTWVWCNNK